MFLLQTSPLPVIEVVLGRNGHHTEAALRQALRQAGIPPDAPYREWATMVPRALTLLAIYEPEVHP